MIGSTDAGVGVGPSFIPEVSEQVEKMLPEFSSSASVVGRLLQDLPAAATGLQVEQAFIQTQHIVIKELLQESGGVG